MDRAECQESRPADNGLIVMRAATGWWIVDVLDAVLRAIAREDRRGCERIPLLGGVIVVANHISNADPLVLARFVARSGRWPTFLAKASLFEVVGLGVLLRWLRQIPVERGGSHAVDALAAARLALEQGEAVIVYPEGTITYDPDLWPMRGRTGAARLALATGCPVVPVGQWGAEEFLRGRKLGLPRFWARPTLRMLVGPPVPLDDLRAREVDAEVLHEATARIVAALTALVAQLRGEPGPAEPFDPRGRAGTA